MEQLFSLELVGEILPHSAWGLDQLLSYTQHDMFETVYFRNRDGGNTSDVSLNWGDLNDQNRATAPKPERSEPPQLDPVSFGLAIEFAAFLAAGSKIGLRWVSKIRRSADGTSVNFKSSG